MNPVPPSALPSGGPDPESRVHRPGPDGPHRGVRSGLSRRGFMGLGAAAASLALAGCGSSNGEPGAAVAQASGEPQRGGILRIGMTGGGASDSLDAHAPVVTADGGRVMGLYDRLYEFDPDYETVPGLAESARPLKGGRTWSSGCARVCASTTAAH